MKERRSRNGRQLPAGKSLTRQKRRNRKSSRRLRKSRGKTQRAGTAGSAVLSPKTDKDKAPSSPEVQSPAQKPEKAVKKEPEKKRLQRYIPLPSGPKGPEKDAPRRGKEQIVYIKLNELHAFKNHPFEVRDDEEMRAMVSSVKDKGVTQPAIVRPREDGGYEIVSGHRRQKASELAGYADMPLSSET